MKVTYLKFRNEVLGKSKIIFAILAVLLILSGVWIYLEYSEQVYRDEKVIASSYTHSANYTYIAPVTLSNPIYPLGTALDVDQPAYFFAVCPTMDMLFTYTLSATDSADLTVECWTDVVATSRDSSGGKGRIFWQKSYPLSYLTPVDIGNGYSLSYDFSLNVPEIQSNVKSVQNQIGYSQGTTIEVVTYVSYEGTINDKHVKGLEEYPLPLTISSSYYQMPEDREFSDTIDRYEIRRVPVPASFSTMKAPIVSFLSSMGLILALGMLRMGGEVEQSHIRKMELEAERGQFKDFISSGTLPTDKGSLIEVGISSIQDLVDAAVDMDARVIHDSKENVYFIINSGIIYTFYEDSSDGPETSKQEQ